MFEPEVFWKQTYCFEERIYDIVGTFRRPHSDSTAGKLCPLAPTRYATGKISHFKIPGRGLASPVATGDLWRAYPPKQSSKTPQIEI